LLKVALNTINLTLLNKVLWIENVLISMGYCIHSKKHEKNVFYHFILSVKIVLGKKHSSHVFYYVYNNP
jgi:hypothetical protein